MPVKRKFVTISFLSLGLTVIAIGIARLLWLLNAFKGNVNSYSVEAAYTAIESSVAIIGNSGPTIKYILSRCIPWLRPSFERASTNRSDGNTYKLHSTARSRNIRSQFRSSGIGYDDLESVAMKEGFEMQGIWGSERGMDDDAKSQDPIIKDDRWGNAKSEDWKVHARDHERIGVALGGVANERSAACPVQIV